MRDWTLHRPPLPGRHRPPSRRITHSRTCGLILPLVASALTIAGGTRGAEQTPQVLDYRLEPPPAVASLDERFEAAQIEALERLNRADRRHLGELTQLVIPTRWSYSALAYSPLPIAYAWGRDLKKLLIVHQPRQVFGAYESGRLVRWGPVSSGRRTHQTPAGLFHLNWRSRGRHSTVDPDWFMPWYFNFHNERGLSLHEYTLPGRPASHACVRLLERDARWLYEWGDGWTLDDRGWTVLEHGTPLLIVGCYEFESPLPWRVRSHGAASFTLPFAPATVIAECSVS